MSFCCEVLTSLASKNNFPYLFELQSCGTKAMYLLIGAYHGKLNYIQQCHMVVTLKYDFSKTRDYLHLKFNIFVTHILDEDN